MVESSKKAKKQRLDELLIQLGYFDEVKVARGWIMAGKVVVDGAVSTKPGTLLSTQADVRLRDTPLRFVSRGGYKLERALERFEIDVTGSVCLDAGASTGGFTDCLLQRGAGRVYAVEVGYGQLRGRLFTDPRVVSLERTNISEVTADDLDPPISFACADLSYLSLRKAVPILHRLFRRPARMVCLVKPLYEGLAQEDMACVRSLETVLFSLVEDLSVQGKAPVDACVSPILGGRGAIEFIFNFDAERQCPGVDAIVDRAITDLHRCTPVDILDYVRCESAKDS